MKQKNMKQAGVPRWRELWHQKGKPYGMACAWLVLLCLLGMPVVAGAATVNVTTAGTLESVINDSDEASFPVLKITGTLNVDDIKFLHSPTGRMATVQTLDLSEVTFVAGGDSYATVSYSDNSNTMDNYLHLYYLSDEVREETTYSPNALGGNNYTVVHYGNSLAGVFAQTPYQHIIMPKHVKEAGNMTFFKCASLVSVEFPAGLERVGRSAFQNSSIKTIDLSGVTEMEPYAFSGCENLIGGTDGVLDLSSLTTIPDYAFGGEIGSPALKSLTHVKFSNALRHIGQQAFRSSSITAAEFPQSLKTIGTFAFETCRSLASITLPEGIETIGDYAFRLCSQLASVEIPSTLSHINYEMFEGTPWLNSLAADDDGIVYIGTMALYYDSTHDANKQEGHELIFREGTTEIGDGFAYINNRSLLNDHIVDVRFPSTLQRIGDWAFCGASAITELQLPAGLKEIGQEAFKGCPIASVDFPEGLESIGQEAFRGCAALPSVAFPQSIKSIGAQAFQNCTSISGEVTIPEGVEDLGYGIFDGCTSLWRINYLAKHANQATRAEGSMGASVERVVIGSKVEYLPTRCFDGCGNLQKVTFEERADDATLVLGEHCFSNCSKLTAITLPKGKVVIGGAAFQDCSGLEKVEIEGVVTEIAARYSAPGYWNPDGSYSGAFEYCTSLTSITFPDGLVSVGANAFYGCSNLKSADLGNSVKSIGVYAFYGGSQLGTLTDFQFGDQLETLGEFAFSEQRKLETIHLGEKLQRIGARAFYNCRELKDIHIPEGTKIIGDRAFEYCYALTSVVLPEGLEELGDGKYDGILESGVFLDCTALKEVVIPSTVKKMWGKLFGGIYRLNMELVETHIMNPEEVEYMDDPFYRLYNQATLRVPIGTIQKYRNTLPWSQFTKIEEMTADESKYALTAADVTIGAGQTVDLLISLNNHEAVKGFQFELTLPEGISVKTDNAGRPMAELTERGNGLTVTGSQDPSQANTSIFVVMSFGGATIASGDGEMLRVPLLIDIEEPVGTYDVKIKEASVTDISDNTNYLKSATSAVNVLAVQYTMGDANHDGRVNVTDVISIVNHILKQDQGTFHSTAADMNGDGIVNVTDALMVVDLILRK